MQFKQISSYFKVLSLSCLIILSLAMAKTAGVSQGELSDHTYSNHFFGFTVSLPAEWTLEVQHTINALTPGSQAAMRENKSRFFEFAAKHGINNVKLFTAKSAAKKINIMVWHLGDMKDDLRTSSDFLHGLHYVMKKMGKINASFYTNLPKVTLGGKTFSQVIIKFQIGSKVIYEHWYAVMHKGYALTFVTDSANDQQDNYLSRIVNTLKFHSKVKKD